MQGRPRMAFMGKWVILRQCLEIPENSENPSSVNCSLSTQCPTHSIQYSL